MQRLEGLSVCARGASPGGLCPGAGQEYSGGPPAPCRTCAAGSVTPSALVVPQAPQRGHVAGTCQGQL